MKKKKLIIYGIGKFAEYVDYVFQNDSDYEVIAFCIEEKYLETKLFNNKPLLKYESLADSYPPNLYDLFIAVGNNEIRKKIFEHSISRGYYLASYISSKSKFWDNLITGNNVFVDEGCVLQPFIKISNNCILFTSSLGHHTQIKEHSLLSGSKTGGNVIIGENCYIGLNASIKQNINIGDNTIIGMNCAIERDTKPNEVYSNKGTTKRKLTSSELGNRFLK
ncbi:sugar O-acyltransferase (sialic acid O-acetyltransferase NeuD family) [Gillisia mitskevichiae]|uniref:Sugar O-acyltransferase (Sialic acid O-acetyltransferase NeuD family) n=1 Tax=Gillisia mitskevichiae TaxID=270921 RepID=A0A495PKR4_9FLAO|nr:DapH/DapD/GlmU-related protein [Gillisia mitskevichiae]RKS50576.1 sugar O-acyltransferase (sialic acid O-acetyltransferase NeuD family) [Gillisia mitskevichiae]